MDGEKGLDLEARKPTQIPHLKQVLDSGAITDEILQWQYEGSGTESDPYIVVWIDNDPRNPFNYSALKKWSITLVMAIATLAVSFVSSAYSGGAISLIRELDISTEVYALGISLVVFAFGAGPLVWAPWSELVGRRPLFVMTYGGLTIFNAAAGGSKNIQTLLVLRFFAGFFGSSPLTNGGGVIFDMFSARERGLATVLFASAPLSGPVLGPIVGGFVGESLGWRWVEGIMAIFTGTLWILGCLVPETYAPILLRKRAVRLSKVTGKVYRSKLDHEQKKVTSGEAMKLALLRPWVLLFKEPIVLLFSLYMAIVYGTLYMLFGAFPIVYQIHRGWSPGLGGLAFLGVFVGIFLGVAYYCLYEGPRYKKISDAHGGFAPPEARLPATMVGGIALPISLIWFSWTNYTSVHFMASIAAGVPFGFALVLIFLGIFSYLIDSYTIFAASVLAANSFLRSMLGGAFPLFTSQMYDNLGIHWAGMIPAFLAIACVPVPFLFYKYGPQIRKRCEYAAQADAFMRKLQGQGPAQEPQKAPASADGVAESTIDLDDVPAKGGAHLDEKEQASALSSSAVSLDDRDKSHIAPPSNP